MYYNCIISVLLPLLLESSAFGLIKMFSQTKITRPKTSIYSSKYNFLGQKDQLSYISNCLKNAISGCKDCLRNSEKFIEVEFPPNRKPDLSVTETLDTNRMFVREFVKPWEGEFGKELWVVFPDSKECELAQKALGWGSSLPFTLTSISGAIAAYESVPPKLIISVNPGFNVEEWIDLRILEKYDVPIIVINGNLDRLRNGYYPRIFYPKLYKVTQEFYKEFVQALFISPIAVGGGRLGAWLVRTYPRDWEVLIRGTGQQTVSFNVIFSSREPPDATAIWRLASKEFANRSNT